MRIKALILMFLGFFVLTACFGQETFHFEGESDHWQVEYVTDVVVSEDSEEGTIKMKYIGENEAPNEIEYNIIGGAGEMSGDRPMQGDTLEMPGHNCSDCKVTKKDDEFDVTIEWNGKSENFTLNSVN